MHESLNLNSKSLKSPNLQIQVVGRQQRFEFDLKELEVKKENQGEGRQKSFSLIF